MRAIELEREAIRRLATQRLGIDGRSQRIFGSHILGAGAEAAILALPVDGEDWEPLQDPDTGALYFVAGISDPGGDDILM